MLKEIKRKVLECAVRAEEMGLCRHRSGNFSIRDEDTGLVCITPTGMDRSEMTYHDIVVVNMKAEVVEALREFLPNFQHEETGKNLDQKM